MESNDYTNEYQSSFENKSSLGNEPLNWECMVEKLLQDNPLSRNLPENKNDKYILYPDDYFIDYWNIVITILILYTAIVTPYRLIIQEADDLSFVIIETTVNIIFFIDVIITLNLSYYDQAGDLIKSRVKIITRYLKTWLLLDLVSCIPLDLITDESQYSKLSKLGRVPKLYRLIKIIKLLRVLKVIKSRSQTLKYLGAILRLDTEAERLVWFFITFLLFIHILSCIWIFIGIYTIYDDSNDWITCANLQDAGYSDLYVSGLYWCVTTLTTVGYGDIHPCNMYEKIYTTSIMIIGILFYSYIIGSLTNVMSNSDSRKAKITKKLENLDEIARDYGFSREFYKKLTIAIEAQHMTNNQEVSNFIESIPSQLKTQLIVFINKKMLQGNKFFEGKPPFFVAFIAPLLRQMRVEENDYVFREDDYANDLYFIIEGELEMHFTLPDSQIKLPFNHLLSNYYFGETDILFSDNKKRTYGVKTITQCSLLLFDSKDFETLLKTFEEESLEIMTLAFERNKRLEEKKKLAHEAYLNNIEYQKARSIPSDNVPALLKLSDVIGQSRSNSLLSGRAQEESGLNFLFPTDQTSNLLTVKGNTDDLNGSRLEDNEKLISSKSLFKSVIQEKVVKEEDSLKLAKKKISVIEKDVQECLRVLKHVTGFFNDINENAASLKVARDYYNYSSNL